MTGSVAADLRRRVSGWRAAERREREVRRHEGPPDPGVSFEAAAEIYDLFATSQEEPDRVRLAEVGRARDAWCRLRQRLRAHPRDVDAT